MAENIQRAKSQEKCGNNLQLNSVPPLSVAIMVVDKEYVTNGKGYTEVIALQYTYRSREAWESGDECFCADCSAANRAIGRRSKRTGMCYTEVITLRYD